MNINRNHEITAMQCEMCGRQTQLFNAMIEGTQLKVCEKCGKHGKVLNQVRAVQAVKKPARQLNEPVEQVASDYAQRIRSAREKQGLSQQEFAKKIMVKESLLHKIETGHYEPPIDLARKLEKILGITLVEISSEQVVIEQKQEKGPSGMTIGDIIKLSARK